MDNFWRRIAAFVLKQHKGVVLVTVILVGLSIISARNIQVTTKMKDMLPADNPQVQMMDEIDRHFSGGTSLFITVEGTDREAMVACAEDLVAEIEARAELREYIRTIEFTELREYVPGDEYKKVNWKVSAHLGKPVVNEFEPEKDQNVFALIDSGRVLYDQREEAGSRLDFIVDSVLLLANSILTRRDQAGLMAFNWKVQRYVPPGKGPGQMSRIMAALFDLRAEMVESDYAAAFNYWTNRNHKRSLLFFYTDFTDRESAKEILGYLRFISRRHLVVCVVLRRDSLATYLEKPLKKEADAYLKGVALELLRERQGIIKELRESGVYVLEAETKAVGRCVAGHYLYLKRRGLF